MHVRMYMYIYIYMIILAARVHRAVDLQYDPARARLLSVICVCV